MHNLSPYYTKLNTKLDELRFEAFEAHRSYSIKEWFRLIFISWWWPGEKTITPVNLTKEVEWHDVGAKAPRLFQEVNRLAQKILSDENIPVRTVKDLEAEAALIRSITKNLSGVKGNELIDIEMHNLKTRLHVLENEILAMNGLTFEIACRVLLDMENFTKKNKPEWKHSAKILEDSVNLYNSVAEQTRNKSDRFFMIYKNILEIPENPSPQFVAAYKKWIDECKNLVPEIKSFNHITKNEIEKYETNLNYESLFKKLEEHSTWSLKFNSDTIRAWEELKVSLEILDYAAGKSRMKQMAETALAAMKAQVQMNTRIEEEKALLKSKRDSVQDPAELKEVEAGLKELKKAPYAYVDKGDIQFLETLSR